MDAKQERSYFLVFAIFALSSFFQVSSQTNPKFGLLADYENTYRNFLIHGEGYAKRYMNVYGSVIENKKKEFPEEIRSIYDDIIEETILVQNFFDDDEDEDEDEDEDQGKDKQPHVAVILPFGVRYIITYYFTKIREIKEFVSKEFPDSDIKKKTFKYLHYIEHIIALYKKSPDYKEIIPVVKNLYQRSLGKKKSENEAKKILTKFEAALKSFFENQNAPDTKDMEIIEQFIQYYLPGVFVTDTKSIDFSPESAADFIDQVDRAEILVKPANKRSIIIRILEIILKLQDHDFIQELANVRDAGTSGNKDD